MPTPLPSLIPTLLPTGAPTPVRTAVARVISEAPDGPSFWASAADVVAVLAFVMALALFVRQVSELPRVNVFAQFRLDLDTGYMKSLYIELTNHGRGPGTILDLYFGKGDSPPDTGGQAPTDLRALFPITLDGRSAARFDYDKPYSLQDMKWVTAFMVGRRKGTHKRVSARLKPWPTPEEISKVMREHRERGSSGP
jgi:hypothetical protein